MVKVVKVVNSLCEGVCEQLVYSFRGQLYTRKVLLFSIIYVLVYSLRKK